MLAGAVLALGLAARVAAGPLSERILFVADPTGLPKIFVVRPDGKDLHRLTHQLGRESEPVLSLTAQSVAFRGNVSGNQDIYRVSLDGENAQRLTHSSSLDRHPSWSPDGQRIVFSTTRYGAEELAIIDSVKGDENDPPVRLTWDETVSCCPSWSPTGEWIAYTGYRGDDGDIYIIRPDGSENTRLTTERVPDVDPAWSPDGQRLVYETQVGPRRQPTLAIMDLATRKRQVLTEIPERATYPCWSPDARYLLFTATGTRLEPKRQQLQLYNLEDHSLRALEFDPGPTGTAPIPLSPVESIWTRFPLPW